MDRTSHPRSRRIVPVVAVAAAAALVLAGCSSELRRQEGRGGRGRRLRRQGRHPPHDGRDGHARGPRRHVLGHRSARAPRPPRPRTTSSSSTPATRTRRNQANLVQNAIDQKVDGIAVTLAKPDAMKDVVAKAGRPASRSSASTPASSDWKEPGPAGVLRPGRDRRRRGVRRQAERGRRQEHRLRHPGTGPRRPGSQRCAGVKKTFKRQDRRSCTSTAPTCRP